MKRSQSQTLLLPTSTLLVLALAISSLMAASPASGNPTLAAEFQAASYTAGSTTWASEVGGITGTTATGGMSKDTSGTLTYVVFNGKESSNSDRVAASIGDLTGVSTVSVEMRIRLKEDTFRENNYGSMLFSWVAPTSTNNYNIYLYEDSIGFNTFNSDLYGIDASEFKGHWKTFIFEMTTAADRTATTQKIFVDGVEQTLGWRQGSQHSNGRTFNSSGNFLLMDNAYSSNTWNAKVDVDYVKIYKGPAVVQNAAPTISSAPADATVQLSGGAVNFDYGISDDSTTQAQWQAAVSSSSNAVATATVSATSATTARVVVTPVAIGTSTMTVTFTDADGATVQDQFVVTVDQIPVISSPDDNSTFFSRSANLRLSFTSNVTPVANKYLRLYTSRDRLLETIALSGNAAVTGSNQAYQVNFANNLALNSSYYVQIDAGAFVNSVGSATAGIADKTTINFTTSKVPQEDLTLALDAADTNSFTTDASTWNDLTANNHDLTFINGPSYNSTNTKSYVFETANSEYGEFATTNLLHEQAYTKILWFKPTGFAQVNNLFSSGGTNAHNLWGGAGRNSNDTECPATGDRLGAANEGLNDFSTVSSDTCLVLNGWHMVAVSFNASPALNQPAWLLYTNREEVGRSFDTTAPLADGYTTQIAAYSGRNTLEGEIAEVYLYDRALTQSEIFEIFDATSGNYNLKSGQRITWDTSANAVTIRNSAGTATRTTTLQDSNSDGIYELEIKLGETVKFPFNSPNSEPVGYTSYFKCTSVIGWDQSTMFPFDSSGNSFYYLKANRLGACNISGGVASPQYLTLPSTRYEYPLSPGIMVTVVQGDQQPISVVGASNANFGETVTLEATGGSGVGARTYSVTGAGCNISTVPFVFSGRSYPALNTAELTKDGAGTCDVQVTKASDTNYLEITSSAFTVFFGQGSQQISFTSTVPAVPTPSDTYSPAATASSGLTVSFAAGGTCTYDAQTGSVTFNSAGVCTVTASQAGNADYLAATNVTQTISVGERNQTISFGSLSDKEFGDAAFRITATSSVATLSVSFTSADNTICTVDSNGIVVLKAAGACTIHADQAGQAGVVAAASRVSRSFDIFPAGSSAPFITSVSRGLGSLTAAILPPSYTGGANITRYEVQAYDSTGELVATNNNCLPATPQVCSVEGLVEGTSYTLKARAFHNAGFGSLSAASSAAAPVGNPDAVRELAAVAGVGTLTISWKAPLDLGGADFVRYNVFVKLASDADFSGSQTYQIKCGDSLFACDGQYEFTGMTPGASYDVKMVTITSLDGSELTSNTALVSQVPYTTPDAVQDLTAIQADTNLVITWRYPAFDGGRSVTSYSVDINDGELTCQPGTERVCTVPIGNVITFDIDAFALNIAGSSAAANHVFNMPVQQGGGGSGGGGGGSGGGGSSGGGGIPPIQQIPGITSPVLAQASPSVNAGVPTALELTGTNLNLINAVFIGTLQLQYEILSNEKIRVIIPARAVGNVTIEFRYSGGKIEKQVVVRRPSTARVNAGTFNGVVALYAAGHLGKRFSAKVGRGWIVIDRLSSNYIRLIQKSIVGSEVSVSIYIDRKLVRTFELKIR